MFRSFGSKVTLIVSRQQVLPGKDPEVAAALEDDFLRSGVVLLKGARANGIDARRRRSHGHVRRRPRGRRVSHVHPGHRFDSELRGPRPRGRRRHRRRRRLRAGQSALRHQPVPHLRGGRRVGPAAAGVGRVDAGPQGRRARDGPAHARAPPPRLRQGGVGDLHRTRNRRRRSRRGRSVRDRPQAARHQGALRRQRSCVDRRRPARLRQDPERSRTRAWCSVARSSGAARPN